MVQLIITLKLIMIFSSGCSLGGSFEADAEELQLSGDGVVVLSYHRIRTLSIFERLAAKIRYCPELDLYTVKTDEFRNQLKFFAENDVPVLSCSELGKYINGQLDIPSRAVVITIDDVDLTTYNNAFPILKEFDIPFSLFVITGHIGSKNFSGMPMSNWEQIRQMHDSSLSTVGSHTHDLHHHDRDGEVPFLTPENLGIFAEDVARSMQIIEDELGVKTECFAYPFGFGTPQTDEVLQKLGIDLIYSLRAGVVTPDDSPHFIKRVLVTGKTWPEIARWATDNK